MPILASNMNVAAKTAKITAKCSHISRGAVNVRPARRMLCAASVVTLDRPAATQLSVDGKVVHELALAGVQRLLEQARGTPTVEVTFRVHLKCGLGDAVKLVGTASEMGRWVPEVAHFAQWTNGDVWEHKLPIRIGSYKYKVVVRKSYGAHMYELGDERELVLAEGDAASGVVVEVVGVNLPSK